jgi:hypothetical protein
MFELSIFYSNAPRASAAVSGAGMTPPRVFQRRSVSAVDLFQQGKIITFSHECVDSERPFRSNRRASSLTPLFSHELLA